MAFTKDNSQERQMVFTTRLVDEATDKINDGVVVKRYQNPWLKSEVGLRRAGVTFKIFAIVFREFSIIVRLLLPNS